MTSVHKPQAVNARIASGIFEEEATQELLERQEREELERLKASIRSVMLTREGRRVIAWLFDVAGLDVSVTAREPLDMVYASARRDLALEVKALIKEVCPALLKTMDEETNE